MNEKKNDKKRWTKEEIGSQAGKNVIITGTGGLGYESALSLAGAGANVLIAGRNTEKGNKAVQNIKAKYPRAKISFQELNLADLDSIQRFSQTAMSQFKQLDILINNAGVMATPNRKMTKDGFELQFGTNHLGHFALTAHLLPILKNNKQARVVTVSSMRHRTGQIHFDDLQLEENYHPDVAYSQSKLANLMFSFELQKRSDAAEWGMTSIGVHPGGVATDLIENGPGKTFFTRFFIIPSLQTPSEGARATLLAATSPDVKGGNFYGPTGFKEIWGRPKLSNPAEQALDNQASAKLWDVSSKLVHLDFA